MTDKDLICPSCQAKILGPFCHRCGEQEFHHKDLSIGHVTKEIFTSATELDGKFISSLWLLVSKPGQLTLDYLTGRRKARLTPFQLLLLVNILFFIVAAYRGNTAFTTSLVYHTNSTNFIHQSMASKMVNESLEISEESPESYAKRFNSMVDVQAKTLVVLMVPMFALVVMFLYPKQAYPVVGSLVFATHLFTFMLLVLPLIGPLIAVMMSWLVINFSIPMGEGTFEWVYSIILFGIFAGYFFLASSYVYQSPKIINLIKSLVFAASIYWVFLIYRMILFFTTFYAI